MTALSGARSIGWESMWGSGISPRGGRVRARDRDRAQNSPDVATTVRPIGGAKRFATVGLIIAVIAQFGAASSQAYPAACKPASGATTSCVAEIQSPYSYSNGSCYNNGPYSSEAPS